MFEHLWLLHLSQLVSGVSIGMHGQLRSWIVLTGKLCVEATPASKMAWISEELCIGCGICVKVRNLPHASMPRNHPSSACIPRCMA